MKTPVTKEQLRNHFTYFKWKYLLLVVAAIFGWNLIYTMTAYHAPEEKKVVMGIYSYGATDKINAYMEQIRVDLMPDMEEMSSLSILPDATYGAMILSTRITSRDCDIYVLPWDEFQTYAAKSGFMALEEVLPRLVADLQAAGVSLDQGLYTHEDTNEQHLYAIPCSVLPGIRSMLQTDTSDMYIGIFYETFNDENVLKFFEQFIRDMMIAPETAE